MEGPSTVPVHSLRSRIYFSRDDRATRAELPNPFQSSPNSFIRFLQRLRQHTSLAGDGLIGPRSPGDARHLWHFVPRITQPPSLH